jgi:hypothetical protein
LQGHRSHASDHDPIETLFHHVKSLFKARSPRAVDPEQHSFRTWYQLNRSNCVTLRWLAGSQATADSPEHCVDLAILPQIAWSSPAWSAVESQQWIPSFSRPR